MKVAIVGRPNVGKSSLFNALTKTRGALVHDRPGVTRDVVAGGRDGIVFLDTAGMEKSVPGVSDDPTTFAFMAAKQADVILFVVDGINGLHPMDGTWVKFLKYHYGLDPNAKIMLLMNKCDCKCAECTIQDFYELGLGDPMPVSAEHKIGIEELMRKLKAIAKEINTNAPGAAETTKVAAPETSASTGVDAPGMPETSVSTDGDATGIPATAAPEMKIAIMGRPNVGKSSLTNLIADQERVIVSDTVGTTRDAIIIPARYAGRDIRIIDTAGLRKKSKVTDDIETLAALKALNALKDANAAILVLDSTEEIDAQSVQIAERIFDAGKTLGIALNKWDLISKDAQKDRLLHLKREFKNSFSQITKPLIAPISAATNTGVEDMMRKLYKLWDAANAKLPTSLINRAVEKLTKQKPPPMSKLKRPMKIKFASQTGSHPFAITISIGGGGELPESYTKYLRRGLAEKLGLEGLPVTIHYTRSKNPYL
ncbi:MAG: ribosome biogenesis GTPase Der [Rickettsiales bacterium]|jgi:GTP-binding protein|nr:ribosome biogenesis GTPase Der [Rickettsiales bacterium]